MPNFSTFKTEADKNKNTSYGIKITFDNEDLGGGRSDTMTYVVYHFKKNSLEALIHANAFDNLTKEIKNVVNNLKITSLSNAQLDLLMLNNVGKYGDIQVIHSELFGVEQRFALSHAGFLSCAKVKSTPTEFDPTQVNTTPESTHLSCCVIA